VIVVPENHRNTFQHRNHELALRPDEGPTDATIRKDFLMQDDVHRPATPEFAKEAWRNRPKLPDIVPGEVNL
jgi:hypothetical protein